MAEVSKEWVLLLILGFFPYLLHEEKLNQKYLQVWSWEFPLCVNVLDVSVNSRMKICIMIQLPVLVYLVILNLLNFYVDSKRVEN